MGPSAMPANAGGKTYDEAYFRKWYRDPRTRVHTDDSVRRKVRMAVSVAEYFLGRKLRSVLDIGAGEGAWGREVRRMRPGVRYLGIDPSEYVVARHGRRRNIRLGSFRDMPNLALGHHHDLIVCADMLQYVPTPELGKGIRHLASLLGGVAFLEAYTSGDDMEGDLNGWHARSKAQYRRVFSDAGLIACGLHCYLSSDAAANAVELELT
ncbi:MAG: class I SAM-dependent methyltransferase [Gemmatimonadaceae bacterium]